MKQLITYSWKTWADWYQNKIIITTTKNISDNIVYMTKPVKRYRKNTFGKMQVTWDTKNQAPRSWWQEGVQQNQAYKTEYQLHLPADFKCVLQKQDLCGPSSSKSFITQYQHYIPCGSCFCEMQWWAIHWTTPSKYGWWCRWKFFWPDLSHSNHL